jgi:hypothetical protein
MGGFQKFCLTSSRPVVEFMRQTGTQTKGAAMILNAKVIKGKAFSAICRKGKERSGTIDNVREVNGRQLLIIKTGFLNDKGKDEVKSFYVDELENLRIG